MPVGRLSFVHRQDMFQTHAHTPNVTSGHNSSSAFRLTIFIPAVYHICLFKPAAQHTNRSTTRYIPKMILDLLLPKLTTSSTDLGKPKVAVIIKKFPSFHGTTILITMFTRATIPRIVFSWWGAVGFLHTFQLDDRPLLSVSCRPRP